MSPLPAAPVAARIAAIQSRIAGIRGAMGHSGGRLGPVAPGFAERLSEQVGAQQGTPATPTPALPPASPLTPPPPLPNLATPLRDPIAAPAAGAPYTRPIAGAPGAPTGAPYTRPVAGTATAPLTRPTVGDPQAAAPLEPLTRPVVTAGSDFGSAVVAIASAEIGQPYVWGGESHAEGGFDCSGLIWHAYRQAGIELPRVSRDQARVGEPVPSLSEARPGDLVAFGSPVDHIGIYAGDGMMVVAPHRGAQVRLQAITATPSAIRRIVPAGTVVADRPAAPDRAASLPPGTPFAAELTAAAQRHGLDPVLLAAVARTESAFDPRAISPAGAQGLMQLMPGTARELGVDPFDPGEAADGAARYLATQFDTFGSLDLALAAYNAGPGNVRRHGGVPPFSETRRYITKVLQTMEEMR